MYCACTYVLWWRADERLAAQRKRDVLSQRMHMCCMVVSVDSSLADDHVAHKAPSPRVALGGLTSVTVTSFDRYRSVVRISSG